MLTAARFCARLPSQAGVPKMSAPSAGQGGEENLASLDIQHVLDDFPGGESSKTAETGSSAGDAKEATVLNRVVRWTDDGLEYQADLPRWETYP